MRGTAFAGTVVEDVLQARHLVHQRMADVPDRHAVPAVEVDFEAEQHQHPADAGARSPCTRPCRQAQICGLT